MAFVGFCSLPEMQRHGLRILWNIRYISVTDISCFTMGTYGSSNSDLTNELVRKIYVLLMIYSPSAFSLIATDI